MNDPVWIKIYSAGEPYFFLESAPGGVTGTAVDKTLCFLLVIVSREKNFKGMDKDDKRGLGESDLDDYFSCLTVRVQKGFEGPGKVGQGELVGDEGPKLDHTIFDQT